MEDPAALDWLSGLTSVKRQLFLGHSKVGVVHLRNPSARQGQAAFYRLMYHQSQLYASIPLSASFIPSKSRSC